MSPAVLIFIIASLLIIAYGLNATTHTYARAVLIFLFIIMAGFIGAICDSNIGLDGNFSIVFSIGAATMFITWKNKE